MNYVSQFMALVDGAKIITILVLIAVDFLLGMIVAIKQKQFQFSKIGNFLDTSVLYYLGGYLLLGVAATFETSFGSQMVTGAFVLLDATLVGMILAKLGNLGLPIPTQLKKIF